MLTDAERAFLKGLRQGGVYKYLVYFDATGIAVEANRCEDISAEQVAALLVAAAHEYARFAEVIEAIKIKVAKRAAHVATYGKPYRAENEHLFRERMDAEYDLEEKIAAALKEGNADG